MMSPELVYSSNNPEPTLGELVTERNALKTAISEAAKREKQLQDELKALDAKIIHLMDTQGVTMTRVGRTTISMSEEVVPAVKDWEALYAFIHEHHAYHLLQRRAASAAWRELYESGTEIPGTEPFTQVKLNIRSA